MKRNRWFFLTLILVLVSSVAYARDEMPTALADAALSIQSLEEAVDARYGSREAWPQGFDAFLAIARYETGLDASYESSTATWASSELQTLEQKAVTDRNDSGAAAKFLFALRDELQAREGFARSWPYEVNALIGAAFVYSGNADMSGSVGLPGEKDLTEDEAIAIAREAIQKQYELTDADVDQLGIYTQFITDETLYGSPCWYVTIGINEIGAEQYYACITSPAGEIVVATRNDGNG